MHRLVEADLEALAARALSRVDDDVRAVVRAWLARPHELRASDVAEVLELAEDELLGSIARFCDARLLAGESHDALLVDLERLSIFFARCEDEGHAHVDLAALVARFGPKPRATVASSASRNELMAHLMNDPYTSTVARRLFGIEGVVPTQAFLRELVALDLRASDEPRVARVVASLGTVVNAHVEVIEALRRAKSA